MPLELVLPLTLLTLLLLPIINTKSQPEFNNSDILNITLPDKVTLINFGFQGHQQVTWYLNPKECNDYQVYDKATDKCRRIYCRSTKNNLPARECTAKEAFYRFQQHQEFIDLEAEKWTIRLTVHIANGTLIQSEATRKTIEGVLCERLNVSCDRIDVIKFNLIQPSRAVIEIEMSEDSGMLTTNNYVIERLQFWAYERIYLKINDSISYLFGMDYAVTRYVRSFCDGVHDRRITHWNLDFEIVDSNYLLNRENGRKYKKGTYLGSILIFNENLIIVNFAMLCERVTGLYCESMKLSPGSYEFLNDSQVYVKSKYGITDKFEIDQDSVVKICKQASFFCIVNETENAIVAVCLVTSCIFLILILVTFAMVPDIASTLPGFNTINLVLTILILQILFLTGSHWKYCWLGAIILHYFILLNFSWSSIIGFHIFRTFVSFGSIQHPEKSNIGNRFYSFVMAHLMVLIVIAIALINEFLANDFAPHFGAYQGVCWIRNSIGVLFYFAIPVSLSNSLNAIFYLASFIEIRRTFRESYAISTWTGRPIRSMPIQLCVFARIATVLSISWLTVLIIPLTAPNSLPHQLAKYLFVFVNTNQGLLLFLAFLWNKRVGLIWIKWARALFRLKRCSSISSISVIDSSHFDRRSP